MLYAAISSNTECQRPKRSLYASCSYRVSIFLKSDFRYLKESGLHTIATSSIFQSMRYKAGWFTIQLQYRLMYFLYPFHEIPP